MPETPARITQQTPFGFLVIELENAHNPRVWKAIIWKNGHRLVTARAGHPLSAADAALASARRQYFQFGPRI